MNKFMNLLRKGRIGQLCRTAVLVIGLIGATQVGLQLYSTWMTYKVLQPQTGQQGTIYGSSPSMMYNIYLMPNLGSALQCATTTIFYVAILYTASVVIDAFFGPKQDEQATRRDDEMAIIFEPLDAVEATDNDDKVIVESLNGRS